MTLKISLKAARINAGLTQEAVAAMLVKVVIPIILVLHNFVIIWGLHQKS